MNIRSCVKDNCPYYEDFDGALKFNKRKDVVKKKNKSNPKMCTLCSKHPETTINPYTGKLPQWFDKNCEILKECLFLPVIDNTHLENNQNLNIKMNKKNSGVSNLIHRFESNNLIDQMNNNGFTFIENVYKTKEEEINELLIKKIDNIKKITDDKKLNDQQKFVRIAKTTENIDKKIKHVGKTLSNKRYGIRFNNEQMATVINWMKICDHFYNFCLDWYNKGNKIFNKGHKAIKKDIFNYYFTNVLISSNEEVIKNKIKIVKTQVEMNDEFNQEENKIFITINSDNCDEPIKIISESQKRTMTEPKGKKKRKIGPVPFDMLTDELSKFCNNLSSNYTKLEKGQQTHFAMSKRDYNRVYRSVLLPKRNIGKEGIFSMILGKMGSTYNREIKRLATEGEINHDCRLTYDRILKKFTVLIPTYENKERVYEREKYVALDPGETIFQAFYGEKSYGIICEGTRSVILKYREKISAIRSILDKNKNRSGKRIKSKKKLRKKKRKLEVRMKNIIKEIHNKAALFLCKNYDKVLIPKFSTQDMVQARVLGKKVNYSL